MPIKKRTFRSYDPAFDKDSAGGRDRKRSLTFSIPTVTGNITKDIFRAPSEVLISKISIIPGASVAASGSNFYTFDLQNASKSGTSLFVQTNQPYPTTAANGLTANAENTIYADQTSSATSLQSNPSQPVSYFMAPNDVLQLLILKQGAPNNLQDVLIMIDYEISGVTTTTSSSTTTSTTSSTSTSSSTSSTTTTTVSSSTTIT